MFWASHKSTSELRVQHWADGDARPAPTILVDVERWASPATMTSKAKNGHLWLRRADDRITAGWLGDGLVGFAWTGAETGRFPHVHVRVAMLRADEVVAHQGPASMSPLAQPHLWHPSFAIAYPGAATNSRGEAAFAVAFGGPSTFPSFAIGVLTNSRQQDSPERDTEWDWGFNVAREGRNTPYCLEGGIKDLDCGEWGDYFTVRPHGAEPDTWVTVGHTLSNDDPNEELKANVEFFWFAQHARQARGSQLPPHDPEIAKKCQEKRSDAIASTQP
jgi:hypothetical protein